MSYNNVFAHNITTLLCFTFKTYFHERHFRKNLVKSAKLFNFKVFQITMFVISLGCWNLLTKKECLRVSKKVLHCYSWKIKNALIIVLFNFYVRIACLVMCRLWKRTLSISCSALCSQLQNGSVCSPRDEYTCFLNCTCSFFMLKVSYFELLIFHTTSIKLLVEEAI